MITIKKITLVIFALMIAYSCSETKTSATNSNNTVYLIVQKGPISDGSKIKGESNVLLGEVISFIPYRDSLLLIELTLSEGVKISKGATFENIHMASMGYLQVSNNVGQPFYQQGDTIMNFISIKSENEISNEEVINKLKNDLKDNMKILKKANEDSSKWEKVN